MSTAGVIDASRRLMKDPVPDREVKPVLLIHLERVVEREENLPRLAEVGIGKCLGPQRVHGRDREQRLADAMAADIQQVEAKWSSSSQW